MTDITKDVNKKDIVVTRVFDVPVEKVWKAWTDPEQVMHWWGPEGFTAMGVRRVTNAQTFKSGMK